MVRIESAKDRGTLPTDKKKTTTKIKREKNGSEMN